MGAVGGLLGIGGGAGGTGFNSPQGASQQEADATYNQAQNVLGQQQGFVNGLVNQANPALAYQSGALQQFANIANGQGPNPAQAQLAQATGQNVANQAALMAGQRGSNANAGLLARQAAMQGANTQQQSAGQAATLQAQQSLNALGQMAGQANQIVGQAQSGLGQQVSGTQGEQSNILNSLAGQNQANASMANTRMGQQGSVLGGIANGAGGILGSIFAEGGKVEQRPMYAQGQYVQAPPMSDDQWAALAANPNGPPQPTAPVAPAMQPQPQAMAQQPLAKTKAPAPMASPSNDQSNLYKGSSAFGKFLANAAVSAFSPSKGASDGSDEAEHPDVGTADPNNIMKGAEGFNKEQDMSASNDQSSFNAAEGGKVPAMVSPGERYLPPSEVAAVKAGQKSPMKAGEEIPGKPKVGGAKNSYANDTVPKTLEEGGLVLPRSVTQAKHPHWEAMKFVQAHMAKGGKVLPTKPKGKK